MSGSVSSQSVASGTKPLGCWQAWVELVMSPWPSLSASAYHVPASVASILVHGPVAVVVYAVAALLGAWVDVGIGIVAVRTGLASVAVAVHGD